MISRYAFPQNLTPAPNILHSSMDDPAQVEFSDDFWNDENLLMIDSLVRKAEDENAHKAAALAAAAPSGAPATGYPKQFQPIQSSQPGLVAGARGQALQLPNAKARRGYEVWAAPGQPIAAKDGALPGDATNQAVVMPHAPSLDHRVAIPRPHQQPDAAVTAGQAVQVGEQVQLEIKSLKAALLEKEGAISLLRSRTSNAEKELFELRKQAAASQPSQQTPIARQQAAELSQQVEKLGAQLLFKEQELADVRRERREREQRLQEALEAAAKAKEELLAFQQTRPLFGEAANCSPASKRPREDSHINASSTRLPTISSQKRPSSGSPLKVLSQSSPPMAWGPQRSMPERNKGLMTNGEKVKEQTAPNAVNGQAVIDAKAGDASERAKRSYEAGPLRSADSLSSGLSELSIEAVAASIAQSASGPALVQKLFAACSADLQVLLAQGDGKKRSREGSRRLGLSVEKLVRGGSGSHEKGDAEAEGLHEAISQVINSHKPCSSLLEPLSKTLGSEEAQKTEASLHCLCTLLHSDPTSSHLLLEPSHRPLGPSPSPSLATGPGWHFTSSKHPSFRSSRVRLGTERADPPRAVDSAAVSVSGRSEFEALYQRVVGLAKGGPSNGVRLGAVAVLHQLAGQAVGAEKFRELLFGGDLALLLGVSAGVEVRELALRTLLQLLRDSDCMERLCRTEESSSSLPVLEAVAACLSHRGLTPLDYSLRRSAIRTFAFVFSATEAGGPAILCLHLAEKVSGSGKEGSSGGNREGRSRGDCSESGVPDLLVALLDYELRLEDEESQAAAVEATAEDRLPLVKEALALLQGLACRESTAVRALGMLTHDKAAVRQCLDVVNRVAVLAVHRWEAHGRGKMVAIAREASELAKQLTRQVLANIPPSQTSGQS